MKTSFLPPNKQHGVVTLDIGRRQGSNVIHTRYGANGRKMIFYQDLKKTTCSANDTMF